jgi:hypothetical protein
LNDPATLVTSLESNEIETLKGHLLQTDSAAFITNNSDVETYLSSLDKTTYANKVHKLPVNDDLKYESGLSLFKHKIPMWIFIIISFALAVWAFRANLSLIPLLGLVSCLYMMAELGVSNWIGFGIWLLIGLLIYFGYSRKNSKLKASN